VFSLYPIQKSLDMFWRTNPIPLYLILDNLKGLVHFAQDLELNSSSQKEVELASTEQKYFARNS
jgi:hypothetical protein